MIYILIIGLLSIDYVQHKFSNWVSRELSDLLESELTIGRIDMGLLNRIIIDDLQLRDRSGKEMLKVARLSAKFDAIPGVNKNISLGTVQLFGFNIDMERETPDAKPNFQFIVDALASKDTVSQDNDLNLRINSLLIRRGKLSYNVLSEPRTPGQFNPKHVSLQNITANISIKALQSDSLNVGIKRLSVEETHSDFVLKNLILKLVANSQRMDITNFSVELPRTKLTTDTIRLHYDSIGALAHFTESVHTSFHLLPSKVTPIDLAAFVPIFSAFRDPLRVEVKANGRIDYNLQCPLLTVSAGNHFRMRGNISFQNLSTFNEAYVLGELTEFYADSTGVAFFLRNMSKRYNGVPPALQHLGTVRFNGQVSGYFNDLVTFGLVRTDLGTVRTDLMFTSDREKEHFAYSGSVQTNQFELGKMLGNPKLGKVTLKLDGNSTQIGQYYPTVTVKGEVSSVEYSQYLYENILLDGTYAQGGYKGKIQMNDENGAFYLDGSINTSSQVPTFNFNASIDHFRPSRLNLTQAEEDTELSVRIKADFTGGSIDEMDGEINIDSLRFNTAKKEYFMDNLNIRATRQDETHKRLTISSPFLRGSIEGDYSYRTLPASVFSILQRYIPALAPTSDNPTKTENNFTFDLHVFDTDLLSSMFRIPLKVYTHSTLKGYFNDKGGRLRIEGYFPRFRYGNRYIESGMLLCENPDDQFRAKIRLNNRQANGAINLSAEAQAKDNNLQATLNWGNSSMVTYSGRLSASAQFLRPQTDDDEQNERSRRPSQKAKTPPPPLKAIVDIQPTDIIVNDTLWKIHPAQIAVDSGKVYVKDFGFNHNDRYLHINGVLSDQPDDTLRLDLKQINIGYVFDIADLGVNFQGEATGPAYASGVLGHPVMATDLFIRNLGLNDGLLGDAQIRGEWHHDVKGIFLDARIKEKDIARTHVHGFVYPLKPTSALDLQIEAENTNLKFIHYYMEDITPEFEGRATGNVHFFGKFKALTMEGRVTGDASMKVEVLNTTFALKDSILITPDGLTFRNNRIFDTQGHEGRMSGELRYEHFKNLRYRFNFSTDNMLLMNTRESADYPFYGTVYGTGNVTLSGDAVNGLNANVAMTTNRNTTFTYIKDYVTTAASSHFIKFVDKTPRRTVPGTNSPSYFEQAQQEIEGEEESDSDIRLNLLIDATPEATMNIIMDPIAGDNIAARGTGNIRVEFYNKGDVRMFGNYRISQGQYKFSLQEVIRKDFTIKDGSIIAFNGAPLGATLDINASYLVNSASLNDLIANASNYVDQTNVKVECLMNISGQLTAPDIRLSLDLPQEREEVRALVRNYIPTDEQMNTQILYLLSIGKFYTSETMGNTQNSDMMSSVLSSTISGQLNNALSNIINSNNWNFGTNFSTGEKGWTDVEFETMLSGQLLNNRLLINGNFGYRDNPVANTNFVGDFEAEWLVNRSGNIRLKAYNESNDRYYTKTNLTTQGIGIIFRKDFNEWRELFTWARWLANRKKTAGEETKKASLQD